MKKPFDAVAWMRERRTQIDEEDKGLTWEEKRRKTREVVENDPLWQNLRTRFIEPTPVSAGAIGEDQGDYPKKERD